MSNKSICLTISHNLFLSREQRYALLEGKPVKVIGVSVPVWLKGSGKTDEPAEEVFCQYEIRGSEDFGIEWLEDGYLFLLSYEMREKLRDVTDQGSECLMFTTHGHVSAKNKSYNALHFTSIQTIEALLKSIS